MEHRTIDPIERVSVLDSTVNRIRDYIRSDAVKTGDKMPTEAEMVRQLGISRSTLREAYRVLQTLGFISMKPGRGAFVESKVGQSTAEGASRWVAAHGGQLSEYMDVRRALEPKAIELACIHASADDIDRVETIGREFEKAVDGDDAVRLATLDEAFHHAILQASGNALLTTIMDQVNAEIFEYRCQIFSIPSLRKNAVGPHREIVAALNDRDVDAACRAMSHHMEITDRDIRLAADLVQEGGAQRV